jgi:prepilin-type N-terminal cleavage/methylation domain-containing protein
MVAAASSRNHSSRGLSLIEVLVAVSLLSVIILALFGLVTAGVRQAHAGRKMTEAATVAQSALERVNVVAPQDILGAASTASTVSRTWTKTDDATVTESGGTTGTASVRTALSDLLLSAQLPLAAGKPATLVVTMDAVPTTPTATTFANCSMVRIIVDLSWWQAGTRLRQIRLQALNLRVAP